MDKNNTLTDFQREAMIREAIGAVRRNEEKPFVSVRSCYKHGFAYKAIVEAVDGEQAIQKKQDRLCRLVSMSHLLLSEAIHLIDEAECMMDKKTKEKKMFKYSMGQINANFEKWRSSIEPMISKEQMKNFSVDFETLDKNVRAFAHLEGWKEPTIDDKKNILRDRCINLHKEFLEKMIELKEITDEEYIKTFLNDIKSIEI